MARAKKGPMPPRAARHDEVVAHILSVIQASPEVCVAHFFPTSSDYKFLWVETERPCGYGFADICVAAQGKEHEYVFFLLEVKTGAEAWSAGDVIRQLKAYRRDLATDIAKKNSYVFLQQISLGFFSERPLTLAEEMLFANEGVQVLR